SSGFPQRTETVSGDRRAHSEGGAACRTTWHRKDAARTSGGGRSESAILFNQRERFRRDVRGRGSRARARSIPASQSACPLHYFHRRTRRNRPAARGDGGHYERRARTDAQRAASGTRWLRI